MTTNRYGIGGHEPQTQVMIAVHDSTRANPKRRPIEVPIYYAEPITSGKWTLEELREIRKTHR